MGKIKGRGTGRRTRREEGVRLREEGVRLLCFASRMNQGGVVGAGPGMSPKGHSSIYLLVCLFVLFLRQVLTL